MNKTKLQLEMLEILKDTTRWTPAAIQEDPQHYNQVWLPAWQKRRDAAIAKMEGQGLEGEAGR